MTILTSGTNTQKSPRENTVAVQCADVAERLDGMQSERH